MELIDQEDDFPSFDEVESEDVELPDDSFDASSVVDEEIGDE